MSILENFNISPSRLHYMGLPHKRDESIPFLERGIHKRIKIDLLFSYYRRLSNA